LDRDQKEMWRLAARFSAVGLELAIAVVLGYFVGRWLDEQAGTEPWLMVLFVVLGSAAGMKALYRVARKTDLEKM
jgi:ATP synthase protein I